MNNPFRVRARVVAALSPILLFAFAGSSSAAVSISTTPSPTYQTDGTVHEIARAGGVVYIAGLFQHVRPAGAPAGSHQTARSFIAALNGSTGQLMTNWHPGLNGPVRALVVAGNGRSILVGGDFTEAGGATHKHIARISACLNPNGAACSAAAVVDPSFKGATNHSVHALAVSGGRIFVGGQFSRVDGVNRKNLAALNADGAIVRWGAGADAEVHSLLLSPNGKRLFVGGAFQHIGGSPQRHLAAVTTAGGVLLPWKTHPAAKVKGLAENAAGLFVAGAGFGGYIERVRLTNGKVEWKNWADGNIEGVSVAGPNLFVTGHFRQVGSKAWPRVHLAALNEASGKIDPTWQVQENGILGGFSVAAYPNNLYVGGNFTKIGGVQQEGFAQFSED
jgi:Domain of unknown function (DUF5122) beta-propeller